MSDYITIPLTQGKETIISTEDSDLANFKWQAYQNQSGIWYARRSVRIDGTRSPKALARVILERMIGRSLEKHELVDHINNENSLDNRRCNLRLANNSENCMNRGIPRNNTSGYKGVHWSKHMSKWRALIRVNKERIHLGYHDNIEDAYKAYCEAALIYHGDFARLK